MAQTSAPKVFKVAGSPKAKFNDFSLDYNKILTDDYNADKLLTVKYNGKGQQFNVNLKGTLSYPAPKPAAEGESAKTPEVLKASSEVKIITNIEGKNVETRFDASGIRTWIDLGSYNIWKPLNLTAKVKTTSAFEKATGWLQAEYRGSHCDANLRAEVKNGNTPHFNAKVVLREKDFRFGFVGKVGLQGFNFRRHNFFVQYHHKDLDVFASHITDKGDTPLKLGTFLTAAIYRLNKHSIAFEGRYQVATKAWKLVFGGVTSVNDKTEARVKVDQKGVLALAARYRHSSNLSLVLGTQLNLKEPATIVNNNRKVPVPVGLTVEFSYI